MQYISGNTDFIVRNRQHVIDKVKSDAFDQQYNNESYGNV